jgi:predicted nucleotidyltransferase component of viral defense system
MFFAKINHVKTDFVMELRPLLMKFVEQGNIKLFSVPDIAAMKLHTICGRGKKKDFFDVYALLQNYSWDELRDFFIKKYSEYELLFLNKSIDYFADADKDPDVVGLAPYKTKWADIKKFIKNNCR